MKKISRRIFIISSLAAGSLFSYLKFLQPANSPALIKPEDYILKKLAYLNIGDSEINKFLNSLFPDKKPEALSHNQLEKLCSLFLLSTDFFQNSHDINRKVIFTGIYNPALNPCNNPFADLSAPNNI